MPLVILLFLEPMKFILLNTSTIVGLLIILSVPMLKDFFTNLIGTILSIILLTIVIGAVIFLGYWLWQKHEEGDF